MAATFPLQVVSIDGPEFEGEVQSITLRSIHGDVAILARHMDYCTAIGMGTAKIVLADGTERMAACIGGMLTMLDGKCRVLPQTWEFSEDIDLDRAESARKRAEERLANSSLDKESKVRAEAKLYRAMVRIGTARGK